MIKLVCEREGSLGVGNEMLLEIAQRVVQTTGADPLRLARAWAGKGDVKRSKTYLRLASNVSDYERRKILGRAHRVHERGR